MKTLYDTVAEFISGDWGAEAKSADSPQSAYCIRAADVVSIESHDYSAIPERFVSQSSFAQRRLRKGDIVIEKSGGSPTQSTGRVVYISQSLLSAKRNIICSNFCTAIRIKPQWDPYFVYQYWRQVYNTGVFFNYEGKTSGLKNLQLEVALKSIPIPEIDLPAQLRIAGVLGSIDEKIELNRKKIAELEALAKTIYDYWFVQFDFPDAHGKPYKSSGGKMVWNEQLKREVPEGWVVKELGGIATFANGINYTNADQCGKTYRIVNVRDISASTIYIHEDGLSEVTLPETLADRYLIPDNSIIIARSGCPGAIRLLSNGGNIIFCGFIIVCKPKLMSSRIYLMFCLKSLEGSSVTHKDSSILNNVSQDMLKRVVLAIPDVMVLQKFNDILSPILKRITTLQGETSQVIKLRDMLLPILMNGQAKVESSK